MSPEPPPLRWGAALLAFLLYLPFLGNPPVLDDVHVEWFHAAARAGVAWSDLFFGPAYHAIVGFGSWHPLPSLFQALVRAWLPASDFWLHLAGAGFHAASAYLVACLGAALGLGAAAAGAAGLLFAVHPALSQAVLAPGWHAELGAAFFSLLAFRAYLRAEEPRAAAACAGFYAAAILCKEHAALLPAVFLAAAPLPARRASRAVLLGGLAAAAGLYAAWRLGPMDLFGAAALAGTTGTVLEGAGPASRAAFALRLLAFPWGLSVFHSPASAAGAATWAALGFWAACAGLLLAAGRGRLVLFCSAWTLAALWAALLPVGSHGAMNKFARNFFSERYLYLAAPAACWLAAAAWSRWEGSSVRKAVPRAVLAGALALLAVGTLAQGLLWAQELLLLENAARRAPDAPEGRLRLGEHYLDLGLASTALAEYDAVLALPGAGPVDVSSAWAGRARVYAERGEHAEAERAAGEAVRVFSSNDLAWGLLGALRLRRGDEAEGLEALRRSLELRPFQTHAYYQRALQHEKSGRLAAARGDLVRVLAFDPAYADARERLTRLTVPSEGARP